jgi:hypothetical protein
VEAGAAGAGGGRRGGRQPPVPSAPAGLLWCLLCAHGCSLHHRAGHVLRWPRLRTRAYVLLRLQRACASLKARLEMVSGIATLLGALPGVFDTDDMRTAFLWLEKFVRNPWSPDDANTYGGEEAWPAATRPFLSA